VIPGEYVLADEPVVIDRERVELHVVNTGDRPVQVGSHYHFAAANPALEFDPVRYWRGPVWVLVNWLVADGCLRAERADRAEALRRSTLELVAREGFREYYDASTGAGIGGRAFSWSAALTLAWLTVE